MGYDDNGMPHTRTVLGMSSRVALWVIIVGTLALVVGIIFATMAIFGVGLFNRTTADYRGESEQIEQVEADGSYRIAAYDHFFDLCASVQSKEAQLASQVELLPTLTEGTQRYNEVQTNIAAIQASRDGLINEYNADARKEGTIGQFRDSDLPFELDKDAEETSCEA